MSENVAGWRAAGGAGASCGLPPFFSLKEAANFREGTIIIVARSLATQRWERKREKRKRRRAHLTHKSDHLFFFFFLFWLCAGCCWTVTFTARAPDTFKHFYSRRLRLLNQFIWLRCDIKSKATFAPGAPTDAFCAQHQQSQPLCLGQGIHSNTHSLKRISFFSNDTPLECNWLQK